MSERKFNNFHYPTAHPPELEMPEKNIVLCFPLGDAFVQQIREAAGDGYNAIVSEQDEIADKIFDADIFCGHAKVPVPWDEVVRQGRLKWIQSSAAGLDHCLVREVIDSSIVVSGCSALFANQVAEQAMALLLGLIRKLPVFFRAKQERKYVRQPTDDLFGKTVGIVGFGGNGQRIAEVLRPMTDKIVASDCFPDSCRHLVDSGLIMEIYPDDQLHQMLPECDVVIITLPLSDKNEHSFDEACFWRCRQGAYVINVGRGSVVDQAALTQSLQSGHLTAAGLDVADPEPIPEDDPLWAMDNVIITPHVGAQSSRRIPVTVNLFCENLRRYQAGERLLNLVDKQLGFPRPESRVDRRWC